MISLLETAMFSFAKDESRENEDSILSPKKLNDGYIFAVADGVGSYKGGKNASQLAIEYLENMDSKDDILHIGVIFNNIRDNIINLSKNNDKYSQAATTLTFGFINRTGLTVGHIGDCRLYIKNKHKLIQKTKDHTQYQKLIDEKLFTKQFLKDKKAKNILTTAIAQHTEMKFDEFFIPYEELPLENDILSIYIMSDGAWEFWDKRPRFSKNTMNSIIYFFNSFKRRIERKSPIDDYSSVAITIKFN